MSLESKLYRILEGKLSYGEGYIRDPSFFVKKMGALIYDECLEFIEDDILDDRTIQISLTEEGLWNSTKEKRLKDLPKLIENNKVFYFNNYTNPSVRRSYKNLLDADLREFHNLTKVRYKYQYLTPEGIASSAMWVEMISHMYKGSDKLAALGYYHSNSIKEEELREIAMSNEWGAYSSLSKSPLSKSPLKMTDYQRKLLSWTNIYRNVRSHPEFPGQRILEDHDAFDGWMILLNRKDGAQKSNKVVLDKLKSNTRNVFMGKSNAEDFEEVMSLNTPEAMTNIMRDIR